MEIQSLYVAINIFRGLFKDVEKTFPVPAGDEYGLKVEEFLQQQLQNIHACISISLWG